MFSRRYRPTVADLLLAAALVALPVWMLARSARGADTQLVARVTRRGRLYGVYPLDRDRVIVIGPSAAPEMCIEIRDGRVRVTDSDCPKGVCRHAGATRSPGRSIVCVPGGVIIEIVGGRREVDVESY